MGEIEPIRRSKGRLWLVISIVLAAVVIDQAIKLLVVNHLALNTSVEVTSWFHISYVLNPGMAFGIEWFSKIALTLFRIVAVGLLGWYIHVLLRRPQTPVGYIATIAFIIAGALGNIIDCVFYGKFMPDQDAGWFCGKVVDMFYFPLIHNSAGEVLFFRPVFNFADSCITCGVAVILLFYTKQLNKEEGKEAKG